MVFAEMEAVGVFVGVMPALGGGRWAVWAGMVGPLVMGGGCAVERSRGRSYLLLADDLEAAGLRSELPL